MNSQRYDKYVYVKVQPSWPLIEHIWRRHSFYDTVPVFFFHFFILSSWKKAHTHTHVYNNNTANNNETDDDDINKMNQQRYAQIPRGWPPVKIYNENTHPSNFGLKKTRTRKLYIIVFYFQVQKKINVFPPLIVHIVLYRPKFALAFIFVIKEVRICPFTPFKATAIQCAGNQYFLYPQIAKNGEGQKGSDWNECGKAN